MKVVIDNSSTENIIFYLKNSQGWKLEKIKNSAQPLIVSLERVLKKHNRALRDIKGIGVIAGQGRFTATRIAVTSANSFAYALKIPVISISVSNNAESIDFLKIEKLFAKAKKGVYISAKYSGLAHISGKRGD